MGCSASVVAVDMVKHLMQALPGSRAMIINHENITSQVYIGNERSMIVCNCIFRLGGAGCVLSNR